MIYLGLSYGSQTCLIEKIKKHEYKKGENISQISNE